MSGGQRERLLRDASASRARKRIWLIKRVTRLTPSARACVERCAEFGVAIFLGEQLLVRGERHHGVADFVREPVGHGLDQAQIGGLDLEPAQLFALRQVVDHRAAPRRAAPESWRWNGTMVTL